MNCKIKNALNKMGNHISKRKGIYITELYDGIKRSSKSMGGTPRPLVFYIDGNRFYP